MQYCASVESFGCEKLHGGGVSKERRLCHFILRFFIASYQSPKICKAHYINCVIVIGTRRIFAMLSLSSRKCNAGTALQQRVEKVPDMSLRGAQRRGNLIRKITYAPKKI